MDVGTVGPLKPPSTSSLKFTLSSKSADGAACDLCQGGPMLGLLTIPIGTSVPMQICKTPLCSMLRCRIWCLCDWHSLGRDQVGRLDAAATGTGAAMLVQAGRADRGEACNLNGHKFNKASADAGRRGCLRRWPRRSGAGRQSPPSRPTTASAASALSASRPRPISTPRLRMAMAGCRCPSTAARCACRRLRVQAQGANSSGRVLSGYV